MATYDKNRIYDFKIDEIYADEEFNCRGHISPQDVDSMASDIAARGLLQPITVEPYEEDGYKFRILCGHRRHKAMELLQSSGEAAKDSPEGTIRCAVMEGLTHLERLAINFNENTQRSDLNLKQEAKTIERFVNAGLGRNKIADIINMSSGWVQVRMYFGAFPERVQDILVAHNVKQGEIREFYKTLQDCEGGSLDPFFAQVRQYKETGSLKAGKSKKRQKDEKRQRNKSEINAMMKHLRECGCTGIITRAFAWCTGAITEGELDKDLEEFFDDMGMPYERIHDDGT